MKKTASENFEEKGIFIEGSIPMSVLRTTYAVSRKTYPVAITFSKQCTCQYYQALDFIDPRGLTHSKKCIMGGSA